MKANARVVDTLRQVASHIYFTSYQLRELLCLLETDEARINVFVIFYFRLVDIHHEKISRLRSRKEVMRASQRLGFMAVFPYIQPNHAVFELNFAHHDERMSASTIVQIAMVEN